MRRSTLVWLAFSVCLLAACGPRTEPPGIVQGRVVHQDKPVTDANIYFEKADADYSVFATLDADGNFQLKTNTVAGLPAGTYRVAFRPNPATKTVLVGDEGPKLSHPLIPDRFFDPATSGITVEVRAGDNPLFNFDLAK